MLMYIYTRAAPMEGGIVGVGIGFQCAIGTSMDGFNCEVWIGSDEMGLRKMGSDWVGLCRMGSDWLGDDGWPRGRTGEGSR
jgi:hypothetical protein